MDESSELDRYRRRAFPTLFLAIFAAMLGIGIIAPLLPLYARDLGATGVWIGVVFGAFSLSRMFVMPVVGRLSDQHGRKGFLLFGLGMYCLLSVAYAVAHDYRALIVIRALHGLGSAMVVPVAMAMIGEMAPRDREGEYMGTINLALFAGFGVGPLIGGVLHDRAGMEVNFYSLAFLTALSFVLIAVLLPRRAVQLARQREAPRPYREILKSDMVRALVLYRFVHALGRGALMCHLPLFAHQRLGLSPARIGVVLSMYILLISFLQRPFGTLADRVARAPLVIGGTALSGLLFLFIPATRGAWSLAALLVLLGLAGASSLPAATAMMVGEGKREKHGMGSLMALVNVAFSAGLGLGPVLGGWVSDRAGLPAVFYAAGGVLWLGLLLFAVFFSRHARSLAGNGGPEAT